MTLNPFHPDVLVPSSRSVGLLKATFHGNQYTTDRDRSRIAFHRLTGNGHAADATMVTGDTKKAFRRASAAHHKAADLWEVAALTPEGSPERVKADQATVKATQASRTASDFQNGSVLAYY